MFKMPPMGPSQDKPYQLTIVAQRWWWILLVYSLRVSSHSSSIMCFFWKMGTWRLNSCSATLRETCSCKLRGSTYWTTASAHQVEGRTAILATRFAALVSSTVWSDGHDTLTAAANSQSLKRKMAATALWSSGNCWWKAFVQKKPAHQTLRMDINEFADFLRAIGIEPMIFGDEESWMLWRTWSLNILTHRPFLAGSFQAIVQFYINVCQSRWYACESSQGWRIPDS